jgi:hypothetical protein
MKWNPLWTFFIICVIAWIAFSAGAYYVHKEHRGVAKTTEVVVSDTTSLPKVLDWERQIASKESNMGVLAKQFPWEIPWHDIRYEIAPLVPSSGRPINVMVCNQPVPDRVIRAGNCSSVRTRSSRTSGEIWRYPRVEQLVTVDYEAEDKDGIVETHTADVKRIIPINPFDNELDRRPVPLMIGDMFEMYYNVDDPDELKSQPATKSEAAFAVLIVFACLSFVVACVCIMMLYIRKKK